MSPGDRDMPLPVMMRHISTWRWIIQRRVEMCLIITGRGISRSPGDIPKDEPEMTEPPWLIAIKASDRASGAAVHHDFALQRSRRGTVVTTIADAAVNIPQSPC